jgi:ABC-2 type transport system permease protein
MKFINAIIKFLIRTSAFLSKEVAEVLRQPRLILTLVLGPFLILLLFGVGFRYQNPPLRSLFVVGNDSVLKDKIEQYATTLGPQIRFAGTTESEAVARAMLREGEVDVIVLTPDNIAQKIRDNEQPVFRIFHNQIDPLKDNYIRFVGRIYVQAVNQRVLYEMARRAQDQSGPAEKQLASVQDKVSALKQAVQQGDPAAIQQQLSDLNQQTLTWIIGAEAALQILDSLEQATGIKLFPDSGNTLPGLLGDLSTLQNLGSDPQAAAQELDKLDGDLSTLNSDLTEFQRIDPAILVEPFGAETRTLSGVFFTFPQYYTPAVIALLLQHLCVTFAALSLVGEGTLGTMELFKVSPLSSFEILVGKYASFVLFSAVIALILTLAVIYGLKVPMLGAWGDYSLIILVLVFTSLGLGFIVSLASGSVSQAVQYSMIILLASVFFTGFFQELDMFIPAVRVISFALPATYGIRLLQNSMLRGPLAPTSWLVYLAAMGIGLFLIAWFFMWRRLRAE